jgi:hypothetical protein
LDHGLFGWGWTKNEVNDTRVLKDCAGVSGQSNVGEGIIFCHTRQEIDSALSAVSESFQQKRIFSANGKNKLLWFGDLVWQRWRQSYDPAKDLQLAVRFY